MTNEQIIADIAMTIYGEDVVMEMLENGEEIPLHTVQGWASRGPYKIKKGERHIPKPTSFPVVSPSRFFICLSPLDD